MKIMVATDTAAAEQDITITEQTEAQTAPMVETMVVIQEGRDPDLM